jgi:hypothetical protein
LPTLRTDAVWKERMGAETKALLAMKDLESMMIDVWCLLVEIVSQHVTAEKVEGSFEPWAELLDGDDIAGIELIQK